MSDFSRRNSMKSLMGDKPFHGPSGQEVFIFSKKAPYKNIKEQQ